VLLKVVLQADEYKNDKLIGKGRERRILEGVVLELGLSLRVILKKLVSLCALVQFTLVHYTFSRVLVNGNILSVKFMKQRKIQKLYLGYYN